MNRGKCWKAYGRSGFIFDEKHDTAQGNNGAGDGPIGNMVLGIFRCMDGSNIHDFFARFKAERSPNNDAQTNDNKNNSGHLHTSGRVTRLVSAGLLVKILAYLYDRRSL